MARSDPGRKFPAPPRPDVKFVRGVAEVKLAIEAGPEASEPRVMSFGTREALPAPPRPIEM